MVSKLNKGVSLPFNIENDLKNKKLETFVKVVLDEKLLLKLFLGKMTLVNPDMLIVGFKKTFNYYLNFLGSRFFGSACFISRSNE